MSLQLQDLQLELFYNGQWHRPAYPTSPSLMQTFFALFHYWTTPDSASRRVFFLLRRSVCGADMRVVNQANSQRVNVSTELKGSF
jgi:hypothetical protein